VLWSDEAGLARSLCKKAGVDAQAVARGLQKLLVRQPVQDPPPPEVGLSNSLFKLLRAAQELQKSQGDSHLAIDHIISVLHQDKDVGAVLNENGLTKPKLEQAVKETRGGRKVDSKSAEDSYEALSKYGHDLVADAESGKLDPVIGRDDEIRRVIRVLSRRTKNVRELFIVHLLKMQLTIL
jgi:ATP-dependent Clp protease ATP-binding subunit ClpB